MNGCCQECGKRKCCCQVAGNTYRFFANSKQTAFSKCDLPYTGGTPTRIYVQESTILSLDSCEDANCLAKELAQIRADRFITCQEQCYFVICVESDLSLQTEAQVTNYGIAAIQGPTNNSEISFLVTRTCDEEQQVEIVGYDSVGNEYSLGFLDLVVGNRISFTMLDLESFDILILDMVYLGGGDPRHLIDEKNTDFARYLVPGINCNYAGTDLVLGQALGCPTLPCGVGFVYEA